MRFLKLTAYGILHLTCTAAMMYFMLSATLESSAQSTEAAILDLLGFLAGFLGYWGLVLFEQRFLY
jgi:hypothetical protein